MNSKLLMTASAYTLGIAGILLSFFPAEILNYLDLPGTNAIVLQILGGLYFGFAMLNWTARANMIGGIYSRPVAIGNFSHFLIVALALSKYAFKNTGLPYVWLAVAIYATFALLFGYVFFNNPAYKKEI